MFIEHDLGDVSRTAKRVGLNMNKETMSKLHGALILQLIHYEKTRLKMYILCLCFLFVISFNDRFQYIINYILINGIKFNLKYG